MTDVWHCIGGPRDGVVIPAQASAAERVTFPMLTPDGLVYAEYDRVGDLLLWCGADRQCEVDTPNPEDR